MIQFKCLELCLQITVSPSSCGNLFDLALIVGTVPKGAYQRCLLAQSQVSRCSYTETCSAQCI